MTKSKRSVQKPESAPATKDTVPVEAVRARAGAQAKLVPMQKRLVRLRKEEAKRQRQLERVQAKAVKTSAEMADVLDAIALWLHRPAEEPASNGSDGSADKVAAKSR